MNSFDSLLRQVLMDAADEDEKWDTHPKADKSVIEFGSLQAKQNELEKYIGELSPELQEKARQCKNRNELTRLIAENDVELSEDALAAVAGGGGCTNASLTHGQKVNLNCPECGNALYYCDRTWTEGDRYYCKNSDCTAYKEHWLFSEVYGTLHTIINIADNHRRRSYQ
jgi:predicted RNA-binding Zn-ribbon protein involved in translation (DUF1610 family)